MSDEKGDFSGVGLDNRYIDSDIAAHPTNAKARYHFDQSDLDRVQRRLKQRHVQMSVPFFLRVCGLSVRFLIVFTGSP
jgi:hypothetical protein